MQILKVFIILLFFETQRLSCQVSNNDPIVGLGLLAPIVRSVNHVLTAPIRNQARFARNRARMRHRHLLRAENPLEDDGPITEESTIYGDGTKTLEQMQNSDLRSPSERVPKKNKNNQRDEEYYLWSLNNWVPYGRTQESTQERSANNIVINDIYDYNKAMTQNPNEVDVQLLANPSFYREYHVVPSDKEMRNIIPEFGGMDRFAGVPVIEVDPEMFDDENLNYFNEANSKAEDYGSTNEENLPQDLSYPETSANHQEYDDFQGGLQENSDFQEDNFVEPPKYDEGVVYNNDNIEGYSESENYNTNEENIDEKYGIKPEPEVYNAGPAGNYEKWPVNDEDTQEYSSIKEYSPQDYVETKINDDNTKIQEHYSGSFDKEETIYMNEQLEKEAENRKNNEEYSYIPIIYSNNSVRPEQYQQNSLESNGFYMEPSGNNQKITESNEGSDIPKNIPNDNEYNSNIEIYKPKYHIEPQENANYFHNLQEVFPELQDQLNNRPNYAFQSRSAAPADARHFHIHHHTSSFKNWLPKDKPTLTESSSSWNYHKQPQIVINNHNIPTNVNNQNFQVAQSSGHSATSQSQSVSNNNQGNHNFNNQNFQGAQTTHGSTSSQSQSITNEDRHSGKSPRRLFLSNELNANTQAAKTFDGSISNQAQMIKGDSGQNSQFSATSGASQTSQSQTVVSRNNAAYLSSFRSPYLVDVPRGRPINRRFNRRKRSLPLVRLMTDPNAKLDMPKTLENFGTVARNAFQDKRQPMYHMKNMVGSARDVFLSALRVPPQGIVIPSQYKIIDMKKEKAVPINDYTYLDNIVEKVNTFPDEAKKFMEPIEGSTNAQSIQKVPQTVKEKIQERINNLRASLGPKVKSRSIFSDDTIGSPFSNGRNDEQFVETFQKMGNIFRESVKSSQQTLNHITDVAHSARKAFTTSTLGAPRVVRPLMHAPVFEKKQLRFKDDTEKVTFVAPKFLDVTNDGRQKKTSDDFIDIGDLMNAFGVSNPSGKKVGLRRYVVHSKVDKSTKDGPVVGNRFGEANEIVKEGIPKKKYFVIAEDIDDNDLVINEVDIVKDLTDILGVNSLKELLNGMKSDMTYMKDKVMENKYKELEGLQVKLAKLEEEEAQMPQVDKLNDKISSDEDIDQFIQSLFTTPTPINEEQRSKRQIYQHRNQHHNLVLPANLLRPFMGSPSRIELNDYFRHHNDMEEVENDSSEDFTSEEMLQSQQDQFAEALLDPNEYISAINPHMYMKLFNEQLTFQDKYPMLDGKKTKDMVKNHNVGIVGASRRDEGELYNDGSSNNERFSMNVVDKLLKPYMGKKDENVYQQSYVDYIPDFGYLPTYYGGYNGYYPNNGY